MQAIVNSDQPKSAAPQIIATALVLGMFYAILRYHIAGSVPWKDLPFYIFNKGVSLSAFILLACNFGFGPLQNMGVPVPGGWLAARKAIGMMGFLLVLVHALISFLLFKPEVYAQFFVADGTVTLQGGISMVAGVLGFVFLWVYNISFQTFLREDTSFIHFITSRRTMLFALVLGGVHVLFMGFNGWLNPAGWHGGLPPISLVAFTVFAVTYTANLFGRR